MEIPARKSSSASTTVPHIYRVSFLVVAVASASFVLKALFPSLQRSVALIVSWVRESFSGWLNPPYLFFLLNCIILAIFVNSGGLPKFDLTPNKSHDEPQEPDGHRHFLRVKEISHDLAPEDEIIHNDCEEAEVTDNGFATPLFEVEKCTTSSEAAAWRPAMAITRANDQLKKMLVSARFTHRKESVHENSGKSLLVTRNTKRKLLNRCGNPPLRRHLRSTCHQKTIIFPLLSIRGNEEESSAQRRREGRRAGSLIRETYVGVDDLNNPVEAFVDKFNHALR